jgi:hypothetical protein
MDEGVNWVDGCMDDGLTSAPGSSATTGDGDRFLAAPEAVFGALFRSWDGRPMDGVVLSERVSLETGPVYLDDISMAVCICV